MDTPIRVLHIDDNREFGQLMARRLENAVGRFSVLTETNARAGLYRMSDMSIDCIVCDYSMPRLDGAELHERVKERDPYMPFVFFTGTDRQVMADRVASDELTAYVSKDLDRVSTLADRITRLVEVKQTVRARRESEERYQRLLETAPGPIFIYSIDGRLRYVNEAGQSLLGADDQAELVGSTALSFVHPEDESFVATRFDRLVEDRESVEPAEQRLLTLDGEEKHVIMASAPVVYEGEPAIQTVGTDISDLKDREHELRRYQTITETLPDIVYTLDSEGCLTSLNAEHLPTGHSRSELIGQHVSTVMNEEDVETGNRKIRALLEDPDRSKATFEMDLVAKDGARLPMENHIALLPPDEDGTISGTIGVLRDISDRVERERQLERERDRFVALFENLPNPSVHGYLEGGEPIVTTVNSAFEEVFGYDGGRIEGASLDDLIVPDEYEQEATELNDAALAGNSVRREVTRMTADGLRDFLLHLAIEEVDGTLEGYAIYTDITEQKDREAELARQNERLDRFASLLSHDIRNPLTVASGRLEMLKAQTNSEHVEEVESAIDRIEELIDDVMAMAREGDSIGEMAAVELAEVARGGRANLGAELELVIESEVRFQADFGRLQQVFENLFRNAVEHAGPSPTVRVGRLDDGEGFYVEDDGPGIPADDRIQVFQPGFSTTQSGTGLGLNIVEEIIDAHGWRIDLTDGTSGGARFEIRDVDSIDSASNSI